MITKLPAAYWPTTVVAIDDDKLLLDSLQLRLGDTRPFKLFSSPQQAVQFLTQECTTNLLIENCVQYTEDDAIEHRTLDINIANIQNVIYNPQRFSQIAVVMLDFSMPGMTGADVARALKDLPLQIILLTGEASHDLATNLFNEGLIKNFLRKDQEDLYTRLEQLITELEFKYSQKQSALIVETIIKKSQQFDHMSVSCLNDPTFTKYFFDLVNQHKIVEYYLIESSGSFLMLDIKAKPSWLLVKDLGDMAALDDLCRFDKATITDPVIQKIKRREVVLHIFNEVLYAEKHEDWQNNLYPAQKISGKTDYFCSYVTQPHIASDLKLDTIESYYNYLQTH